MSRFSQLILILLAFGGCGVSGECDITGLLQQAAVRPHSEQSDKEFVLIHIPKTGGTSEIQDGPLVVAPHSFVANTEEALKATPHTANQVDVINLRLPIDHVLSQFLQCKYGFAHRHHSSSFPTGPNVLDGFEEWTRHFVELKSLKSTLDDSSFLNTKVWAKAQVYNLTGCYNPWNMQTRYLATDWNHTAGLKVLEPDLQEAKKNLKHIREHGVLGITELYVESLCMLHLRAHGTVPSTCECGGPGPVQGGPHHETREVPKHNASSLSPELLERMHTLTHMDIQLYAVALDFFEQDLLDASEKTGVQMVCQERFENLWAKVHQMHQQIGVPLVAA